MPLRAPELLLVAAAFASSLVLTVVVRALARRWGVVARPRADRWHQRPTALLGGVAVFATVTAVYLAAFEHTPRTLAVVGGAAWLWLVGLVDDLRNLKPYQKLIGQILGAAAVVAAGMSLPWTPSPLVNMALTLGWLVGITNAVNLLDNMDGLAAGVAVIASVFLMVHFAGVGLTAEPLLLAVFAAALLGFLVFNFNPASIFMGDSGSLFTGFFVAAAALLDQSAAGRTRSFLPVLAVPVLVLCIPIFDTTLVTILRKLAGRAASQGGRDHTSHRLVALGLSERRAVGLLYALAAAAGALAVSLRGLEAHLALAAVAGFTLALTMLGVYLADVKVYDEAEVQAARRQPLVAFLIDLSYKRRVFEVLLDSALIVLSYYVATLLRFGRDGSPETWEHFLRAVPVVLFAQLTTFLLTGVYRGLWRYVSLDNLLLYGRSVALGALATGFALLVLFRFEGYSRAVLVLDAVLLLVFLGGSRLAFRLLRRLLPGAPPAAGRRVLIYGAGDGGELLARELLNNHALAYQPVGFADDDPLKKGKVIHGLRVLGGNGAFLKICAENGVEEVVLSSTRFTPDRVAEILGECERAGVRLTRMRLQIEAVGGGQN